MRLLAEFVSWLCETEYLEDSSKIPYPRSSCEYFEEEHTENM